MKHFLEIPLVSTGEELVRLGRGLREGGGGGGVKSPRDATGDNNLAVAVSGDI